MNDEELKAQTKELTEALLDQALKGKHKDVELLTNITTLRIAAIYKRSLKKLYKEFDKASKAYYLAYLQRLKHNIDDVALLFKHRTLQTCADFYKVEYNTVDYEIDEFHTYMFTFGNFINTILCIDRPENEMYDHNKNFFGIGNRDE